MTQKEEQLIHILDNFTINQIAAGEVIERPMSVVKELVDNAIDAGSSSIFINVVDGGLTSIQVADDGFGMGKLDLLAAFGRHATSKLATADDLPYIGTLGFRGEALSSIAAVSHVTAISRTAATDAAYLVEVKDGKAKLVGEEGARVGTTVRVDGLFYNVPARKKFLKKPHIEMGYISDLISKFVLACPHIAFSLKSDGRLILNSSGNGDLLSAALTVYGYNIAGELLPLKWRQGDLVIEGLISPISLHRSSRNYYNFFINERWIKNQQLGGAVDTAYETQLPGRRYPIVILKYQLPPETIDVNVHPAKMEIRFKDWAWVQENTIAAIKQVLNKKDGQVQGLETKGSMGYHLPGSSGGGYRVEEIRRMREKRAGFNDNFVAEQMLFGQGDFLAKNQERADNPEQSLTTKTVIDSILAEAGVEPDLQRQAAANLPFLAEKEGTFAGQNLFLQLVPLGQLAGTYVVAAGPDGLYLVDQHAAHERIYYESFAAEYGKGGGGSALLAVPEKLELTHQQAQWLIDNILSLADMGFVVEHFGDNTFLLRGVPAWYQKGNPADLFFGFLDVVISEGVFDLASWDREKLFLQACKSALKANSFLTDADMTGIFAKLAGLENCLTCPHGRPIIIKITLAEISRRFLRG